MIVKYSKYLIIDNVISTLNAFVVLSETLSILR